MPYAELEIGLHGMSSGACSVELRFTEFGSSGLLGVWRNPLFRLLVFISAAGFAVYFLFMKRTLQHLDPSSVIPERVRQTLDILAEGVAMVDRQERIGNGLGRELRRVPVEVHRRQVPAQAAEVPQLDAAQFRHHEEPTAVGAELELMDADGIAQAQ